MASLKWNLVSYSNDSRLFKDQKVNTFEYKGTSMKSTKAK